MNRRNIVWGTAAAVGLAFVGGVALNRRQSGEQAQQAASSNEEALVRAHAPVFGNPDAKVTIVEFFDPACETCRAFHPIVKNIVTASFGQVRVVLRYAPLHQGSDRAVQILEAARLQGKYWEALERTLAGQPSWADHGSPRPEQIWTLLDGLGLDLEKARADALSPAIIEQMRQDIADMRTLRVQRTPTFIVNGKPLNDFGEAQLRALVAQAVEQTRRP